MTVAQFENQTHLQPLPLGGRAAEQNSTCYIFREKKILMMLMSFLAYGWRVWNLNWPFRFQLVGKNCTVLNTMQLKSIEVRQLFSLKTVSNIQEKECIIPKTISDCKKMKIIKNILIIQASNLAPTSGNSLVVRRVSPSRIICSVVLNKICCSSSN